MGLTLEQGKAMRQTLIAKTEDVLRKITALKRLSDNAISGIHVEKIINKYTFEHIIESPIGVNKAIK